MDTSGIGKKIKEEKALLDKLNIEHQAMLEKILGQPECVFCGKQLRLGLSGKRYSPCDCAEAQKAVNEYEALCKRYESKSLDVMRLETWLENSHAMKEELRKKSGMGKRTLSHTFANFNPQSCMDTYQKAIAFVNGFDNENNGRGLIIFGGCGVGKTHLVAAIANEVIERYEKGVCFEVETSMFMNLMLADLSEKKAYIAKLKDAPLLILDDMGKEKVTEWNRSVLFDIVNFRYDNMLPTIITSNLGLAKLEEALTTAIYSRLCEVCEIVYMQGKDGRR